MAAKKVAKKSEKNTPAAPVTEEQRPATPEVPVAETSVVPQEQTQPVVPDNGAVTVYDMRGKPHRTYSLEVHGERYRELAEMFISDRPGWSLR